MKIILLSTSSPRLIWTSLGVSEGGCLLQMKNMADSENVFCEPPLKRKRGNKKTKKNWRTSNITDVEEHLEEIRSEERTG